MGVYVAILSRWFNAFDDIWEIVLDWEVEFDQVSHLMSWAVNKPPLQWYALC